MSLSMGHYSTIYFNILYKQFPDPKLHMTQEFTQKYFPN